MNVFLYHYSVSSVSRGKGRNQRWGVGLKLLSEPWTHQMSLCLSRYLLSPSCHPWFESLVIPLAVSHQINNAPINCITHYPMGSRDLPRDSILSFVTAKVKPCPNWGDFLLVNPQIGPCLITPDTLVRGIHCPGILWFCTYRHLRYSPG